MPHLPFLLSDLRLCWNHSSPHRHWFGCIMAEHMSGCFSDVTIVCYDTMWSWDAMTRTSLAGWAMSKSHRISSGFWCQLGVSAAFCKELSESICPHYNEDTQGQGLGLTILFCLLLSVPFPPGTGTVLSTSMGLNTWWANSHSWWLVKDVSLIVKCAKKVTHSFVQ